MTSTDRRAREQTAVREKILAAARELFVREGYEAVSMRKIAGAVEYTPPAIYTHFKDKAALMTELCRRDFGALAEHFNRLAKVGDPVERIYRIGMLYIRFAVENPNHYRLMFMTPVPKEMELNSECLQRKGDPSEDAYAFLRAAVKEAIEAGAFQGGLKDADLITQVLWAGVHGVASLQITHADDPWIGWRALERRGRLMCESLLRGMLTPAASKEFAP